MELEYRDLRADFPEGEVLGALYFNDKLVVIDQSLVPEDFPSMRGRYRFTLAHELGHWRLHRHLYLNQPGEMMLLPSGHAQPDIVLRAKPRAYDVKEVQANRLASCLLMPRDMVKRAWHAAQGSLDPIYLDDLRAEQEGITADEILRRGGESGSQDAVDNVLLERISRPMAEVFEVSAEAMRIRLEGLGLLVRGKKEPSLFG